MMTLSQFVDLKGWVKLSSIKGKYDQKCRTRGKNMQDKLINVLSDGTQLCIWWIHFWLKAHDELYRRPRSIRKLSCPQFEPESKIIILLIQKNCSWFSFHHRQRQLPQSVNSAKSWKKYIKMGPGIKKSWRVLCWVCPDQYQAII